jgi:membrane protein insertase Oxa1/YidC/SpoIIIJ
MLSGGIDRSTSALSPHGSILAAIPFFVLAGLVVAAALYQQRLSLTRRAASSPVSGGSRNLMRVMPAFTGLVAISLPAGVTLYYLISSLFRIGQQQLIRGPGTPSVALRPCRISGIRSRARAAGRRAPPEAPSRQAPEASAATLIAVAPRGRLTGTLLRAGVIP